MHEEGSGKNGSPQEQLAQVSVRKAEALLQMGRIDEAVAELHSAHEQAPGVAGEAYARALMARGEARERVGNLAGASADYRAAQAISAVDGKRDQSDTQSSQRAANIQEQADQIPITGGQRPTRCLQCSHEIRPEWVRCPYCGLQLQRGSDDLDSLFQYALITYHKGNLPEAKELLQEIVRRKPDYAVAGHGAAALLAEVDHKLGDVQRPPTKLSWALWMQWAVANAVAWAVGLGVLIGALRLAAGARWTGVLPMVALVLGCLIAGAIVAAAQWIVLMRQVKRAYLWAVGTAILWGAAALSFGFAGDILLALIFPAIAGAIVAAAQWIVLMRQVKRAYLWVLVSSVSWALAGVISQGLRGTFADPIQVAGFTAVVPGAITGGLLGIVVGTCTGMVLIRLLAAANRIT